MPTNHLIAYNSALMGFTQRGKAQQACSVVLASSFVDRQNGLCAIFFLRQESRFAFMYSVFSYQRKIIKETHLDYPVCELLCKMI